MKKELLLIAKEKSPFLSLTVGFPCPAFGEMDTPAILSPSLPGRLIDCTYPFCSYAFALGSINNASEITIANFESFIVSIFGLRLITLGIFVQI